jgi:arylsulfatase A-like enzyme
MRGPAPFEGGRVVRGSVGLIDVLPTFFDWARLPVPEGIEARSALPLLRGESSGRPVVAEEMLSKQNTGHDREVFLTSVRTDRWKYVLTYDRTDGTLAQEMYDLHADPGEHANLLARGAGPVDVGPEVCARIREVRQRLLERAASDGAPGDGTPRDAGSSPRLVLPPEPCR